MLSGLRPGGRPHVRTTKPAPRLGTQGHMQGEAPFLQPVKPVKDPARPGPPTRQSALPLTARDCSAKTDATDTAPRLTLAFSSSGLDSPSPELQDTQAPTKGCSEMHVEHGSGPTLSEPAVGLAGQRQQHVHGHESSTLQGCAAQECAAVPRSELFRC